MRDAKPLQSLSNWRFHSIMQLCSFLTGHRHWGRFVDNDPVLLGQRVVAILETGRRTATYKLATLMALIEHCIENLPERPSDMLRVPLPALAHRVLEIYWQQVRPFDGNELRQSTGSSARILRATKDLMAALGPSDRFA